MLSTYYCTLCCGDGGGMVVIKAPTAQAAREEMFRHYGPRWAFLYDDPNKVHELDRTVKGEFTVKEEV